MRQEDKVKRAAITFSAILVILLVSSAFGQSYLSVYGPNSILDNTRWVQARVDTGKGFFGIGTYAPPPPKMLLWDFVPVMSGVGNSNFIVRIDGSATYGLAFPGAEGSFSPPLTSTLEPFHADGYPRLIVSTNTIHDRWILNVFGDEIVVNQYFQPDSVDTLGVIRIRYLIQNNGTSAHTVALEHKYDININGIDDAAVAVPGSYARINTFFEGAMPGIFLAAERGFDDSDFGLVAKGIINQHSATAPQFFAYGEEMDLLLSNFSITSAFAGGIYSLSGALLRWNDILLPPGASREIITYYGLGDANERPGQLNVVYTGAPWTTNDCECVNPNVFNFIIRNDSDDATIFDSVFVSMTYDVSMASLETTPPYMSTLNATLLDMAVGEDTSLTWAFHSPCDTFGDFCFRFYAYTNDPTVDFVSIDTCYSIPYFDRLAPIAELITPINPFTACTTGRGLSLELRFEDEDNGVRYQNTVTRVRIGEDSLVFNADNIDDVDWSPGTNALIEVLTIDIDYFDIGYSNGDTIEVCVLQLEDMNGCSLDVPECWTIIVDTEPPFISNIDPPPGSAVSAATPIISFQLHDSISGVDSSSILIQINALPLIPVGPSGATWNRLTNTVSYSLPGGFPSETWVNVCLVIASDNTDLPCGPNSLRDTCWSFFVDYTPPVLNITQPIAGSIISCDTLTEITPLIIIANDSTCIDTTVGTITFSPGPTINLATWPYVNWFCNRIEVFGIGLNPGLVDISVSGISDQLGNEAGVAFVVFTVDTLGPQPNPFSITPTDGSIISSLFNTSVNVYEESGLEESTIEWRFYVNSSPTPIIYPFSSPHVSYVMESGTEYRIVYNNTGPSPLPISDGDTLRVCLAYCQDVATLCGPNPIQGGPICWTYYVDGAGPEAELIWPTPSVCTKCNPAFGDGTIQVRLRDLAGIDISSVAFRVNGISYPSFEVPDADSTVALFNIIVTYGHTLRFCPDSVEIELYQASDNLGNITSGRRWFFTINNTPPFTDPATWEPYIGHAAECITVSPYDTLRFCVDPGCCGGFFHDSVKVILLNTTSGFETIWSHEHPEWWSGDCFNIPIPDVIAGDGDSIFINLAYARDSLHYMATCGSNVAVNLMSYDPYDWGVLISAGGPIISRIKPARRFVSCDNFQYLWRVSDSDGLIDTSMVIHVWSETTPTTVYTWGAPEIGITCEPSGEVCYMTFDLDLSAFAAVGESVCVRVVDFYDALYVRNEASSTWCVRYDNTNPCPIAFGPEDVGLSTRTPDVWAVVPGDIAPVLPDSLGFSLDGGISWLYRAAYPTAIYWVGDTAHLNISALPDTLWPRGGDTVEVCIRNTDNTDTLIGCPLNKCTYCWSFWIEANGPVPSAILPRNNWIVTCATLESLVIAINDSDAIVWDSAWATCTTRVNGLTWSWDPSSPGFDGVGYTLKLFPSPVISVEDTYDVWIYAVDELMNPLVSVDGIYHYTFIVDHTPPDSIWFTPNCHGDSVDSPIPTIWLHALDEWGRVDSLSWCLEFWHTTLVDWVEICYDSLTAPAWEIYPESVGLHTGMVTALDPWWRGGDTIQVRLSRVCDVSHLCPPNCTEFLDTCLLPVPSQGPSITNLWPDFNGILGCPQPDTFVFVLFDNDGIDTSTVRVKYWTCDTDTTYYSIGSPSVAYYTVGTTYDTLGFVPPDIVDEGCTLWIEILAQDIFANDQIQGAFHFVYDYTPPGFEIAYSPIDEVMSYAPRIPMRFPDNLAGVDTTSVYIRLHSWCGPDIDSIHSPAPDTLIWVMDSLGRPDTLIFNFAVFERCMSTDSSACLTVYGACDLNAACEVCTTFDTTWCFTVMQGGPQVDFYHPPSTGLLLCPNDSIVMDLLDPDGVDTDGIYVMVNGVVYPYPSPGFLFWDAVDTRMAFYPSAPFDTSAVQICIWGGTDMLGYDMDSACVVFNVDIEAPVPTYIGPFTPVADPQPDISIRVVDEFSPIVPDCFELLVEGDIYNLDGTILSWVPDSGTALSGTLIWSAVAAGETLLVGDTIWICLMEACDSTGCDDNNYLSAEIDSICWWFRMAAGNGPEVTMTTPPECDMAISCSTSFQIIWHVFDEEGFADYSLDIAMFDRISTVHYDMDSPEITFLGRSDSTRDTVIILDVPPISSSGWIWVSILNLDDVLGNPALFGVGDTCRFFIDWDRPYTSAHWPGPGEEVATPYPACWWEVQDTSWKIDKNTGQVVVNGTRYDISMPQVWWTGDGIRDTLWFQPAPGEGFMGGDTVIFCIDSVADSTIICEPNWIEPVCETFYINADGPMLSLIFPDFALSPNMVTFCDSGAFWVRNIDPEGVDTMNIEVIWNETIVIPWIDSGSPSGYFDFVPGTADTDYIAIWPPFSAANGDEICLRIPYDRWTDTLGNGLVADKYWCATVDLTPPVLVDNFPADDETTDTWTPNIFAYFEDSIAFVGHGCVEFYIEENGAPWFGGTFVDGDPQISWNGDTVFFTPANDFAEFATVCIDITICDSTTVGEPMNCPANVAVYSWCFIIGDDDTIGPELLWADTCYTFEGNDTFTITVGLADENGIYDDASTDTTGQGIIAHITFHRGGLTTEYWLPMDIFAVTESLGAPRDSIYWASTIPGDIPSSELGAWDSLCYEIWAYDNDFDFDNPIDRQRSISATHCCVIYDTNPPLLVAIETPAGAYNSCVGAEQGIVVGFFDWGGMIPESLIISFFGADHPYGSPDVVWENGYVAGTWVGIPIPSLYDSIVGAFKYVPGLPEGLWENGDLIDVCVTGIYDIWFNQAPDTCWTFISDTEPPLAWCVEATDTNQVFEDFTTVQFGIYDSLAGVNSESIILNVQRINDSGTSDGFSIPVYDPSMAWDPTAGVLTVDMRYVPGYTIERGDSLFFSIYAVDRTVICDPNAVDEYLCVKYIKPITRCHAGPHPFTPPPPADGFNDEVIFDYPGRFDVDALIKIYDMRGRLMIEIGPGPSKIYKWDGYDFNGAASRPGVYTYVVEVGGEVICSGTVVLAR